MTPWCAVLVLVLVVIAGITNASPLHAQSPRGKPGGPPLLFLGYETLPPMIYTRNGEAAGLAWKGRGLPIQLPDEYPEVRGEVIPDLESGFDLLAADTIIIAPVVALMAVIGQFVTIRHQRRIAQRLRESELVMKKSESRLHTVPETIPEGVVAADAETRRLVFANASFARMLGVKDSQAILLDAACRVRGMRLLYDKLYLPDNFHDLETRILFTPLIEEILAVFSPDPPVVCTLDLDVFTIAAKLLSPLAIILNELVTNSLKYAFTGRADGNRESSDSQRFRHATGRHAGQADRWNNPH